MVKALGALVLVVVTVFFGTSAWASDGSDKSDRSQSLTAAAQPLSSTATSARSLSPTARLPAPKNPGPPALQPNSRGEDFFILTTISLPFTALYAFALATAYTAWVRPGTGFPPQFEDTTIRNAAIGAVSASLLIATVSISWGGPGGPMKPAPLKQP